MLVQKLVNLVELQMAGIQMMKKMFVEFAGLLETTTRRCIIHVPVVAVSNMFIRNVYCNGLTIAMLDNVRYAMLLHLRLFCFVR